MWLLVSPTSRQRIASYWRRSASTVSWNPSGHYRVRLPPVGNSSRFSAADTKGLLLSLLWRLKLELFSLSIRLADGCAATRKSSAPFSRCALGYWPFHELRPFQD